MLYDQTVARFGGMKVPGSRFAVFPTLAAGEAAQSYKLFEREGGVINSNLTLREQIYKWAPPSDDNETETYLGTILNQIGPQYENVKGRDIPAELRPVILETMRQVEGFKKGRVTTIKPGSGSSASNSGSEISPVHAAAQGAIITPLPKTPTDTLNLAPPNIGSAARSSDEDEFTTSSNPIDARPKSYSANPMDEMKNKISFYSDYLQHHFGYLSDEFDLHTSGELTAEQAYKRTMNPLGR